MADLLNVSVSGLLTAGRALATVSHNVANVDTPGYSRQVVTSATRPASATGVGYLGSGVEVTEIRRNYDDLVTRDLRNVTSSHSQVDTLSGLSDEVDNLLADSSTGLSPALEDFFSSVSDVADNPTATASRQTLLGASETLARRMNTQGQRLNDIDHRVNSELRSQVSQVNDLAEHIATLNTAITDARGMVGGGEPNDLLDQRDEVLRQLAEKVPVRTMIQGDGSMSVFVGKGQGLVIGTQIQQLAVVSNPYNLSRLEIGLKGAESQGSISGQIDGGSIGGLLRFRDEVLEPTRNSLGRIAAGLAEDVNTQHKMGIDRNGELGGDLFKAGEAEVAPRVGNSNSSDPTLALKLSATVTNANALTNSNYQVDVTETGYSITRLSDGSVVKTIDNTLDPPETLPVEVDGFSLSVKSGTGEPGDSFLVRPTRVAADGMQVLIQDPNKLAAGSPVTTALTKNNIGDGHISAGQVVDPTNAAFTSTPGTLTPPLLIKFNELDPDIGVSYSLYDNSDPNNPVLIDGIGDEQGRIPYNSATGTGTEVFPAVGSNSESIHDFGYRVTLSGNPKPGDSFTVGYNQAGSGDNRNMLALASMQSENRLDKGNTTFQGGYGSVISEVGVSARRAKTDLTAQTALLSQAKANRESISGVNLDEEAADLLRYQQAYQASAQVIATANTLFQSILGVVGR